MGLLRNTYSTARVWVPTAAKSVREKVSPVLTRLDGRFTDFADWVSDAMGSPPNILFWLVLVITWTLAFALNPALANSNFLPAWFTSQAYNFPLNLLTTVAELFIGFLVAAAANRVQRVLFDILRQIKDLVSQVVQLVTGMKDLVAKVVQQQERIEQLEQTLMDHVATTAAQHSEQIAENTAITKAQAALTQEIHTMLKAQAPVATPRSPSA